MPPAQHPPQPNRTKRPEMPFDLFFIGIPFHILASLVVVLSLARKWLLSQKQKSKIEPQLPGPIGLPWAGPLWSVDPEHMWLTFAKWSKTYGPIYKVTLFGVDFVCISHPEIAKDIIAKQGAVCSDRPTIPNIPGSKTMGEYLPFLGHNDVLRRQRKFGTTINNTAFKAQYHGHVMPEIRQLLSKLYKKSDHYDVLVEQAFARISCKLAWGVPEPATAVVHNAHNLMKNLSPAGRTVNVLAFLRHLPQFMSAEKQHETRRHADEFRLWSGLLDYARRQHAAGQLQPCYAKQYFDDIKGSDLNSREAIYGVGMMATVAILTLSAPIGWFIIAMAMFPEWQKAAQEEIDLVCGERMPELSDMPSMPTLRAIIIETLRWHGTVPTGIPHALEEDVFWNGYTLKKGTNVMACDWAMSRNPSIYTDADKFNPDRWLNPAYSTFRGPLTEFPKVHGHHAFGFGRRTCIGQDHVASVLFSACGSMLWGFNLKPEIHACGKPVRLKVETATPHVIPLPAAQKLYFEPRNEKKAMKISTFA